MGKTQTNKGVRKHSKDSLSGDVIGCDQRFCSSSGHVNSRPFGRLVRFLSDLRDGMIGG